MSLAVVANLIDIYADGDVLRRLYSPFVYYEAVTGSAVS